MTSALPHARHRFPAAALVAYLLVGIAHNYARTSPDVAVGVLRTLVIVGTVLVGVVLLFFAAEVVRRRRAIETLGFLIGTRRSSAVIVGVGILAAPLIEVPPNTAAFTLGIALPFLAVLVEEILFRPVLITLLHHRLSGTRRSRALAVVVSAAIWTVMHVPSKPASLLVGLFVAGVVLGALYAWSGTNVAGYVLHALANAGSVGAVMMFVLCLVLGAAGRLMERTTDLAPEVRRSGVG